MVYSGIVACKGKIEGRVIHLNNLEDVDRIDENSIIITSNNSPLYSLAFMKAGGIISEVGGELCHLAIISREMNKPCIMGVIEAKKKIPEGSIIKLDATNNKIEFIKND